MSKQINEKIPFFLPFKNIQKGLVNADADIVGKNIEDYQTDMIIEGIAGTDDLDLDGQTMNPEGFVLDYFLKSGFINWNHQMSINPDSIVGQPIDAKAGKTFYIKGKLYKWSNLAKNIYQMAINLQEDPDSDRTLGYSVEGLGVEEKGGYVSKTIITSCAIAPVPKNNKTYLNVCKGITVDQVRELRKDLILKPLIIEIEKGITRKCYLDIKVNDHRLVLDENYNFEILKYEGEKAKMSPQQALVILSKALNEGLIKEDKKDEFKKLIKKNRLKL